MGIILRNGLYYAKCKCGTKSDALSGVSASWAHVVAVKYGWSHPGPGMSVRIICPTCTAKKKGEAAR